jgi:hypothetical protein
MTDVLLEKRLDFNFMTVSPKSAPPSIESLKKGASRPA